MCQRRCVTVESVGRDGTVFGKNNVFGNCLAKREKCRSALFDESLIC